MSQLKHGRRNGTDQIAAVIVKTEVDIFQIQGAQLWKILEEIIQGFALEQVKTPHRQLGHVVETNIQPG
ncbi:hypothetical protein D3C84_1035830 [compost metagenome]